MNNFETMKMVESRWRQGATIRIRRVSLGQRLSFISKNATALQKMKFLASGRDYGEAIERNELELSVCRNILALCVDEISGNPQGEKALVDWLIDDAPQAFATEVLQLALDEVILSDSRRKN